MTFTYMIIYTWTFSSPLLYRMANIVPFKNGWFKHQKLDAKLSPQIWMNGIIHTWIVSCTFQKWVLTDSFISSVKQDALSIVMSIPTYDFFHFETFFPLVVYLCYSQIPLRQMQLLSVSGSALVLRVGQSCLQDYHCLFNSACFGE